ncbi:MAG: cell envelope integrity protein TolA [Alistipes sp.]|nr:cell envelope integrity protein TolA [Alistipes sp.]
MNRLTKILGATLLSLMVISAACSNRKGIPDNDLVKIFHDAFIANAYCNEKLSGVDSLLIYEPILARYGYTIDDMRFTVQTISQRKSSRLSDLVGEASRILEEESKGNAYQLMVLDTIDNVAKRKYTRVMLSDTLIKAHRLKDTSKLHIVLRDIIPGEYNVTFDYLIDTTDENRNSRVEAYLTTGDSSQTSRNTLMLSRYRDAKYQRKFTAESMHRELHINLYYHNKNEEHKKPGVTIRNLKITRVLPNEQALDSLYEEQMGPMLFNHKFLTTGQAIQPKRHVAPKSSNTTHNEEVKQEAKQETKPQQKAKPKQETKPQQKAKPKQEAKPKANVGAKGDVKAKSSVQKPDAKLKSETPKRGEQNKATKKQNN